MGYKSINRLSREIKELSELIESGEISENQLETILSNTLALHERCLILRYKIEEQKVTKALEKKKNIPKTEEEIPVLFKVEPIPAPEISINQTSLIDVIEEIEDEKKPVEVQSAMFDMPSIIKEVAEKTPKTEVPSEEIIIPKLKKETIKPKSEKKKNNKKNKKAKEVDKNDSLVDKMKSAPIADLASSINLNLKFRFIKNLFDNDNETYKSSIQELNDADSLGTAKNILETIKADNNWEEDLEEEILLIELLERKHQD